MCKACVIMCIRIHISHLNLSLKEIGKCTLCWPSVIYAEKEEERDTEYQTHEMFLVGLHQKQEIHGAPTREAIVYIP